MTTYRVSFCVSTHTVNVMVPTEYREKGKKDGVPTRRLYFGRREGGVRGFVSVAERSVNVLCTIPV